MKNWKRAVVAGVGGAAVGATAAIALGKVFWNRATARAVARLRSAAPETLPETFSPTELSLLPAPVQRYFTFALTPGQPCVKRARVVETGEFWAGEPWARWSPFLAVQHFAAGIPGFVWDARIFMNPLVTVRVRDSYMRGVGAVRGTIGCVIPLMDESGKPGLSEGALHRYLAEAVWLPTALLPGRGAVWEPIDESNAKATLTDRGNSVSLNFEFAPSGEIVRSWTDARNRLVNGASVPTPWTCSYGSYAPIDGMMVPRRGEAAWILPEGERPYCRMHLRKIEYDRAITDRPPLEVRTLLRVQDVLSRARPLKGSVSDRRDRKQKPEPGHNLAGSGR